MPSLVWKPWAPLKCKPLLGCSFQIEFGRPIDLREEDDKIVEDASFVTKFKNPPPNFYSSAGSPFVCGIR
jgi:hypothetical protein